MGVGTKTMLQRREALPIYIAVGNRVILDEIIRELSRQAGIQIVGSTSDAARILAEIARFQPWVVLIHCDLGTQPGIEIISSIDKRFPGIRIIALSDQSGLGLFREAIRAGARDFVIVPQDLGTLSQTLRARWTIHGVAMNKQEARKAR